MVSSTGCADIVLKRADVANILPARGNRPLVLVDIAVPRDIDPAVAKLPNVFLYDIDDLEAVVRENTKNREQELSICQLIIDEHAAELMAKLEPRFIKSIKTNFNEGLGAELVPGFSFGTPGVG